MPELSLEGWQVCAIGATAKIVREGKIASEPEALIAEFRSLGVEVVRSG
jgi:transposase